MFQANDDRLSDEDMVKKVQSGKIELFGALAQRYGEKMMRYAKRFLFGYEDAEDLVQNVFIKAFVDIQSFDTSRKFSPWLYRIAHNEFINAIKKKSREPVPFFSIDTLISSFVSAETADKETNKRETRDMIDKCLSKLNHKYREPLVLYYFEELSYKEIADVLRIPISTVGIRLKRGRETLKSFYKNNYDEKNSIKT